MNLQQAYITLGVPANASMAEVKAAYRRRARATHPDQGGDAAEFILVQAAYEVVCAVRGEAVTAEDIPVPEELREMIQSIIADFHAQLARSQALSEQFLDRFERDMHARISRASRGELRTMGGTFATRWNGMTASLFATLNSECAAVLRRYDRYMEDGTERVFKTLFVRELRSFSRSRRFWGYVGGSVLLAAAMGFMVSAGGGRPGAGSLVLLLAVLCLGPVGFVVDAALRRPRPPVPTTMAVEVFRVDPAADFRGSLALRQGRRGTVGAGAAGLFLGEAVAGGLAGPVVGAAVGVALGGAVDRLVNPTGKVREAVALEFTAFMRAARPAVIGHVTAGHQVAAAGLQERLLADYEARMKQTVRALAGGE